MTNHNSLRAMVIEVLMDLGLIASDSIPQKLEPYVSTAYKESIIEEQILEEVLE